MINSEPRLWNIGDFVGYVAVEKPVDLVPDLDSYHYVLQTEPGREMTAQANLIMRKVPFYLPTLPRAARISARRHAAGEDHPDVMIPLFPRTIFISEQVLRTKMRLIQSTPGVCSNPFMKFGEHFAVLRPEGMQAIHYIEAGEREMYYREAGRKNLPSYIPKVGEEVAFLVEDTMRGLKGKVADVDDAGRITLLIEIMKRTVRVKTTADRIGPV